MSNGAYYSSSILVVLVIMHRVRRLTWEGAAINSLLHNMTQIYRYSRILVQQGMVKNAFKGKGSEFP